VIKCAYLQYICTDFQVYVLELSLVLNEQILGLSQFTSVSSTPSLVNIDGVASLCGNRVAAQKTLFLYQDRPRSDKGKKISAHT